MSDENKAPWHLWVVGGVTLLWNGFGAFDFTATIIGFEPYLEGFPPELIEYVNNRPFWMFIIWAVGVWGGFIGSALLLARKGMAVPMLVASFAGATLSMLVGFFDPAPEGISDPVFSAVIVLIAGGLAGYAWWLGREDVLD